MANYGGSRFPRYPLMEGPRPRFNAPPNRHGPRHNFNDHRPQLNKSPNVPRPRKPANDTPISTPPASNPATAASSTSNASEPSTDTSNKPTKLPSSESSSTAAAASLPSTSSSADKASTSKTDTKRPDGQQQTANQKRPRLEGNPTQLNTTFDSSTASSSYQQNSDKKGGQGGRCRLFIGNIPSDLTQDEFQLLFGKYGELVEYFVNPSRGFGFIKLSSRQLAEQAKYDLDGHILRGKPLRIRFASQGATVKVKNLSPNVSNELLKEAFEQYFGGIERAVVIVDDRGKSTGEGIIEFEKKPSAQKCLNDCTERCFFVTSEMRPVIVEPWDTKDEEDGLPEKSLTRNPAFLKEREAQPRFAEINTIEHTIGLKWKELELQEKQLLEEVKQRMQYATEQMQAEIDQMHLEHQSQMLREELLRRQEDLRRIDELRSQEIDRRRNFMPMQHHPDAYNNAYPMSAGPMNNVFHQNQVAANAMHYNDFPPVPFSSSPVPLFPPTAVTGAATDAAYTTNQVSRGYTRPGGDDFHHHHQQQQQQQGFDRKRPRH